jgi:hypothetical protein
MDNQGWGRKWTQHKKSRNKSAMEFVEQTICCAFVKNMALSGLLIFFVDAPLDLWRLETMELSLTFFFACGHANFFFSIAPCLLFSKGFGGDVWDMSGVFILKGHIRTRIRE